MTALKRRRFFAPPLAQRCKADRKPLKDGTGAQCMRRATFGAYCYSHRHKSEA